MTTELRIGLVGTGAVAVAVGRRYVQARGRVAYVLSRDAARGAQFAARIGATAGGDDPSRLSSVDLILVAVPDRAIADTGRRLADATDAPALHTSGALDGAVLGLPEERSGSLHPLQAVTRIDTADNVALDRVTAGLGGCHWFHEGAAAGMARDLVSRLGGTFHPLAPGSKTLYHAAAAVLSNHTVALFGMTLELLAGAGISAEQARHPFGRLLEGTVRNLGQLGIPGALTGPVSRGDDVTVAAHLAAIEELDPTLADAYRCMASMTLRVARLRDTYPPEHAERVARVLATRRDAP